MSQCSLPSSTQSHDQKQAATWRAPQEVAQDGNILSTRSSGFVFLIVGAATSGRPARKAVRSIVGVAGRISPANESLLRGRGKIRLYCWRSLSLRTGWARHRPRGGKVGARRRDANHCWQSHVEVELDEAYNRSLVLVLPYHSLRRSVMSAVSVFPKETMGDVHEWRMCSELEETRLAPHIVGKRWQGLLGSLHVRN